MTPFDSEIASALRALELDVRERVARWLNGLDGATVPAGHRDGILLQPVHFTCRVPSAHFKEQMIAVYLPDWQLRPGTLEVALESYAVRSIDGHGLVREADALVWKPLAADCSGAWASASMTVDVPQLRWSLHEVLFRVPSLVMNAARLRLDLPACAANAPLPGAAVTERLQHELRCAGRIAQARIAGAVASLFREALRDLLNLRAHTLARIDAVGRAFAGAVATVSETAQEPDQRNEIASPASARHAVIATFAHEVEALERQAVQLASETLEGLALRAVDSGDITDVRPLVVPARHRLLGALRLQLRGNAARGVAPGDRGEGLSPTSDDSSTPRRQT